MTGNHHVGIRPEADHRPSDDADDTSVTGRSIVHEPELLALNASGRLGRPLRIVHPAALETLEAYVLKVRFLPAAFKEIRGCH
ncbi:hypothetical protein [Streptomyces sp. SID1121]|uniref:hypothetical protein n=1 Tax=Streptomyces sp. SID1121 TaxID=3425888 RepID=UPI004057AA13